MTVNTICTCLCRAVHPRAMGICRGEAETTVPFFSERTGRVDVRMCEPCAREARKRGRPRAKSGGLQ